MLTTDQVLGKGRYRIISNFKQDGTGSLYEAYDTVNNSTVVLRETAGSNGGVMTPAQLDTINNAFADEAKTLTQVDHESLLHVQDYFSEIDRHYLVMESVDGTDLTKSLEPGEKAPALSDVMKWADQLLAALEHLHTLPHPIIHRDVRPANIRLTSAFKVKLLTAGVSSHELIMAAAANPADSSVLNYRPLEQLWGGLDPASQKVIANSYDDRSRRILQQPLDPRSDIYSVGATLYHVITGTLPKDALERSIEILDGNGDPLVSPSELDPSMSEELSEVIMKSMELRREHRYDSAGIMRQVLNASWQRAQANRSSVTKLRPTPEPVPVAEPTQTVVDLERLKKQEVMPPLVAQVENFTAQEETRAEERRREIEADREKQRLETERIKLAEMEESSPVNSADLLLEVEPVKTVADNFEWSVDISEQPSRSSNEVKALHDSTGLDFNLPVAPGSNMKFVAAGAGALVVVVAIAGWVFMGGSPSPANSQKAVSVVEQPAPAQQPAQTEQVPVSTFTDQNSPATSTEQAPQINESVTVGAKPESRPAVKEKKPTPTPPKKKVTVDDLINDN